MCQPGRPAPQGLGHDGSPGLAPFQSAKSCGLHVGEAAVREFAVRGEAAHAEVDTPVGDGVREARADQPLDQGEHRGDVRGGARLVRRRQAAEPCDVLPERADLALGELGRRDAHLGRAADDLVVDVGEVADERDREATGTKVAAEDVGRDERTRVTDVRA